MNQEDRNIPKIRHFKYQSVAITVEEARKIRDAEIVDIVEQLDELRAKLGELNAKELPTTKQIMAPCAETEATYSDHLVMGPKFVVRDGEWKPTK